MSDVHVALLPQQLEVIRDDRKVVGMRGGVGSGKTVTSVWDLLYWMSEYPKARPVAIGASYRQLQLGFLTTLRGILDRCEIPYVYTSSPQPKMDIYGFGLLETLSAEMREHIRSLEADYVVVEEPQTWDAGEETFLTLIERLRPSPGAVANYPGLVPKIRASFNPPPVGHWIYELFEKKFAGVFPCYRFSLRDNFILHRIDPTYLPLLEATLPKDRWPREIEGHWGTVATGVYRGFDANKHTIQAYKDERGIAKLPEGLPPFAIDAQRPLHWSLDFNVSYMASTVGQFFDQPEIVEFKPTPFGQPERVVRRLHPGWQKRLLYVFDELFLHDAGTPDAVNEFIKRYGVLARSRGVVLHGDASGAARSQAVPGGALGRSNWQIVCRMLREANIPYTLIVQKKNPDITDRINAVRDQFSVGADDSIGMLVDADKCPELVNDFNLVQYVPGKNEIDKTDKSESGLKRTHTSDALGYKVWIERLRAAAQNVNLLADQTAGLLQR